jgi:hypothetical protein
MALSQARPQPEAERPEQRLVLHLDLLHNWSDLVVLGFAVVFSAYLALGELLARGWSNDPDVYNNLSIWAPLALGLSVIAWRRFRRISLSVDEGKIEAVSVWGVRKECRLQDLSDVTVQGRPLARELHFNRSGTVAFKVWRKVWTGMQLRTLSVFLGSPVPNETEPMRGRVAAWTARLFILSLDGLFLIMGGAVLVSAFTADLDAHIYQRASAICSTLAAASDGGCYVVVPVTVAAVGQRSFGEYAMTLTSYAQTYETTAASSERTYRKFSVGMTSYAKLWKGKLTLIQADKYSVDTTDNPLYEEGWARTGVPTWIVALVGLIPVLARLHPIVT